MPKRPIEFAVDDRATRATRSYARLCEKFYRALSINGEIEGACGYAARRRRVRELPATRDAAASLAVRLARRTYEAGRPHEAAEAARRALRLSGGRGPAAYDAHVTLAHFEALQGRRDAAAAELTSAEATLGETPDGTTTRLSIWSEPS